jgi:hypothetical protein
MKQAWNRFEQPLNHGSTNLTQVWDSHETGLNTPEQNTQDQSTYFLPENQENRQIDGGNI